MSILEKLKAQIEKELKGNTLIDILQSLPGFGKVLSHLASLKKLTTSTVSEPRLNLPRTHIFSLYLSRWSESVLERIKHRKGSNVPIVALARRLSEIDYRCLKEKRYYEERPCLPYIR